MDKKNNILNYFSWFVVVLIVGVGAWIFIGDVDSNIEPTPYSTYNSYVVYEIKDDKSLRYNLELYANGGKKYIHIFKNHPEDLLDINSENGLRDILYKDKLNDIKKDKIYFSYDPSMDGGDILSAGTLIQILGTGNAGVFNIPVVIGVSEDNGNPDFPIKTCSDSNEEIGVMLLQVGEPKIYKDKNYGNCIVIQGNNKIELDKLMDYISYNLLGVIE